MENIYLNQNECGFSYDTDKVLDKPLWKDVLAFRDVVSQYGNIYVIDDHHNFFKQYLSTQIGIKGDMSTVYGKSISERMNTIIQPMLNGLDMMNKYLLPNRLLVLGGDVSIHKFFMMEASLGLFNNVMLVGKLGLAFVMVKRGFNKIFNFELNSLQVEAISYL